MQSIAGGLVPDNSSLTLVCDTNGLDLLSRVTLTFKGFYSAINALLNRADELFRIMLMPSKLNINNHSNNM